MLGINSPKVFAKGEYAKAVHKAALAAKGVKVKDIKKKTIYPYKFEWIL